ncbi:Prephenate decarboxylase [Trichinella spiralis]|uniref:Prephenate decarboxylase n=1 Tax=Trichinella spiralis TaxID=6334 RepID=A0ABR3K945_TRISP
MKKGKQVYYKGIMHLLWHLRKYFVCIIPFYLLSAKPILLLQASLINHNHVALNNCSFNTISLGSSNLVRMLLSNILARLWNKKNVCTEFFSDCDTYAALAMQKYSVCFIC